MLLAGVDEVNTPGLINFFFEIVKIILPILIFLVAIPIIKYVWQRFKKYLQDESYKKHEKEKIQKQISKANNERRKNINKFYRDKGRMESRLDNIDEPFDKSKYRSLDLSFDENGKAKL